MADHDTVRSGLARAFSEVVAISGEPVPLRRDPVDNALIAACLDAASAGLAAKPRCEFVVVRDVDRKHQLARIYRQGWSVYRRVLRHRGKAVAARQWEADHFEDVPVIVVGCARGIRPLFPAIGAARFYASVLPPMQNLMLAARALDLSATWSTLPVWSGWQTRRTLSLPWTLTPVAVATVGWPTAPLRRVTPHAAATLAVLDHHGQPFPNA